MNIIDRVSKYMGISLEEVRRISENSPVRYKRYRIDKNSGGTRTIYQPPAETKGLQYALMSLILENLPIHDIATAYRYGEESPQRRTAEAHAQYEYSVRLDYQRFFYSIKPSDLFNIIEPDLTDSEHRFLKGGLFVYDNEWWLAIGAPSSPMISNAVSYGVDDCLQELAYILDNGSTITRYADDIVFSTNKDGVCFDFHDEVRQILSEISSPDLRLNDSKTSFMSRGNRRVIAGLVITPDGDVSIGRDKKRRLRSMIDHFRKQDLSEEQESKLQGYLAWVLDVEPSLYNRLAMHYGADVMKEALSGP